MNLDDRIEKLFASQNSDLFVLDWQCKQDVEDLIKDCIRYVTKVEMSQKTRKAIGEKRKELGL